MDKHSVTSISTLFKSCILGLFWASLSLAVTLYFEWSVIELSKAVYIFLTYSAFLLTIQFAVSFLQDDTGTVVILKETPAKTLSHLKTFLPTLIIALAAVLGASKLLYIALVERTAGWDLPSNIDINFIWFLEISIANWWLILVLVAHAISQSYGDYRLLDAKKVMSTSYSRTLENKYILTIMGLIAMTFTALFLIKEGTETIFYYVLILIFFLPWESFFFLGAEILKRHKKND